MTFPFSNDLVPNVPCPKEYLWSIYGERFSRWELLYTRKRLYASLIFFSVSIKNFKSSVEWKGKYPCRTFWHKFFRYYSIRNSKFRITLPQCYSWAIKENIMCLHLIIYWDHFTLINWWDCVICIHNIICLFYVPFQELLLKKGRYNTYSRWSSTHVA